MKKLNGFIIFVFILIIAFFTGCHNPVMEKWWFDDSQDKSFSSPERSGVNFGVVVFDTRGGSPAPLPVRVLWGNTVPRIRAMNHPDSSLGFAGWLDERGNPWNIDTRPVKPEDDIDGDGNIVLTAVWSKNIYTVSFAENLFNLNGTAAIVRNQNNNPITVADQRIASGGRVTEPSVIPRGDGQGLVGWYTGNGMAGGVDSGNEALWGKKWDFANDTVTGNITLYARWSIHTRTVHLQVNGGTRPGPSIPPMEITRVNFTIFTGLEGTIGGVIIDPGPIARNGYTFGGWYTDLSYTNEWNFSDRVYGVDVGAPGDAPFTLYARWVPNIYLVTFYADGGTPAPASQNVQHDRRIIKPPDPVKPGYDFAGWFSLPSLTPASEWDFDFNFVTSNVTLFAKWEVTTYTVVFHWGNPPITPIPTLPVKPANQRGTAIGIVIEPPPPVVREGYSFFRWDYSTSDPASFPLGVNDPAFRLTLQPWNFSSALASVPAALNGTVLNLYARWVPPEPDMVWVPGGRFIMGEEGVSGSPAILHAYPTRIVTLNGFYINRYPVTQFETAAPITRPMSGYCEVMGNNPSNTTHAANLPVERVSWFNAIDYSNKRSVLDSLTPVYSIGGNTSPGSWTSGTISMSTTADGYRLPTEAEWEYAARGGHGSPGNFAYAGSNDANAVAWFNTNSSLRIHSVGEKQPTNFGIYDMSGNVSEWVWDIFDSYKVSYYNTPSAAVNPTGPAASSVSPIERVRRGGCWSNAVGNVRSVVRNSDTPDTATWVNGFRVVRGPGVIW